MHILHYFSVPGIHGFIHVAGGERSLWMSPCVPWLQICFPSMVRSCKQHVRSFASAVGQPVQAERHHFFTFEFHRERTEILQGKSDRKIKKICFSPRDFWKDLGYLHSRCSSWHHPQMEITFSILHFKHNDCTRSRCSTTTLYLAANQYLFVTIIDSDTNKP